MLTEQDLEGDAPSMPIDETMQGIEEHSNEDDWNIHGYQLLESGSSGMK